MIKKNLFLTNRNLLDLNPLIAGEEQCVPNHSFGPAVRDYTLIHYVVRGKGVLYARGKVWPVKAGQAFFILPGEVTTYVADSAAPWHYCWIGFDGALSAQFAELPPVLDLPEEFFRRIMWEREFSSMAEYHLASDLLGLYAYLFSGSSGTNSHVRQVETYIQSAYMHPIRVDQIAAQLNLDRSYLSRLFKEQTGRSIQNYLIHVRMEAAERYLRQGSSVKEAAHLSGYEDVSNFSKMFKKQFGRTPASLLE